MAPRRAEPFGSGWQVDPARFARQAEAGGVFGPPTALAECGVAARTGTSVDADSVSSTLGWLFLEQGHLGDAEAIFARVLLELPGDARAIEGQREVERQRRIERRVSRLRRFLDRVQRPID